MLSLRAARTLLVLLGVVSLLVLIRAVAEPVLLVVGEVGLGALGPAELGVSAGLVTGLLLVLVCGIGAVVSSYAARNLTSQRRLRRFAALELVAVLGLAAAVVAPSLVQLALGWTVGGLAVAGLVGHAGTPQALRSMRVVRARLLVGDAALWALVVVAGLWLGTLQLGELSAAVAAAPAAAVTAVALLAVVAGVARSALVPMHRWLQETAEAPSPVSALLHAGLVNGVGVLSLLLWPVVAASVPARGVLLVLAVWTAVLGTAQVRVRPDVKGRLAGSTTAQMGYLGVQVALGLPAAVLAHLVGHGMWKASLFLGAGGAIERARTGVAHPGAAGLRRVVVAALVALVVVGASATVPGPWGPALVQGPASLLPAALAAVSLTAALVGAQRLHTRAHTVALAASVAGVVAYVLGLRALTSATESVLVVATPGWGEPGWVVVTLLLVLLLVVGSAFWWLDGRARRGDARTLVDAAARTSLPPAPLPLLGRRRAAVGADLVAAAAADVPRDVEVAEVRDLLHVTAGLVSPLWPLESFVASNPLASLEFLDFDDALEVAGRTWGTPLGISGSLLRHAVEAGRVDDGAVAAGVAELLDGRDPHVAGVPRVAVVRETLLHDQRRSAARSRRGTAYSDLVLARVLADPAWPAAAGGAWAAVRSDAGLDRALRVRGARALTRALPERPDRAIAVLLRLLGAPPEARVELVGQLLTDGGGWAAHVAWRLRQGVPVPASTSLDDDDRRVDAVADLVAVRLLEVVARGDAFPPAVQGGPPTNEVDVDAAVAVAAALGVPTSNGLAEVVAEVRRAGVERLRLQVWEHAARRQLLSGIRSRATDLGAHGLISSSRHGVGGADAQLVTCIDVRSERLRRQLEAAGPWETFGAAGFFGLPLRHVSPSGAASDRCPVLIRPDRTVVEGVVASRWTWSTVEAGDALHAVEGRPFTPYALAEASGWLLGPLAALRTAAPAAWTRTVARVQASAGAPVRGPLRTSTVGGGTGFATGELVDLAAAFLRSTGLVDLAPLVVLCGHAGAATNNPHLAAYDCGACGGRSGDVSARAMTQVLNDPVVRAGLAEHGIDISATTFVAALHDTTRDRVTVLDGDIDIDEDSGSTLARLLADLGVAADAVAVERRATLPQAPRRGGVRRLRRHLDRRAGDWAQVRPEWGLAGNAAMVIGPRSLTSGCDLDGRVFLQSYRPDVDRDGVLLESLLAGPLVVGQWISAQYWFSTVAPERFGAGDKTTHNVVVPADGAGHALSGVFTGARGDLRLGLPWQAVSAAAPVGDDWPGLPQHEPVRLLAVVCAPRDVVERVLERQPQVARLVLGGWVSLQVVDPESGELHRYDEGRRWVPAPVVTAPVGGRS